MAFDNIIRILTMATLAVSLPLRDLVAGNKLQKDCKIAMAVKHAGEDGYHGISTTVLCTPAVAEGATAADVQGTVVVELDYPFADKYGTSVLAVTLEKRAALWSGDPSGLKPATIAMLAELKEEKEALMLTLALSKVDKDPKLRREDPEESEPKKRKAGGTADTHAQWVSIVAHHFLLTGT